MLFVLTETRQMFEGFCRDHDLWGVGWCHGREMLRGYDNAIVMVPLRFPLPPDRLLAEIEANPGVVLIRVPESRREQERRRHYEREHGYPAMYGEPYRKPFESIIAGRRGSKQQILEDYMDAMRVSPVVFYNMSKVEAPVMNAASQAPGLSSSAPQTQHSAPPAPECNCQPECLCRGIETT